MADVVQMEFRQAEKNPETGEHASIFVDVKDRAPHMGAVHVEGRRYVEVSVELFVELMMGVGMFPVDPREKDNG